MRIAVLGLGNAGRDLHLPAIAGLSDLELVGAADLDAARREQAAATWKVPVVSDLDALLGTRPDLVVVGTPPEHHVDACVRCLGAGVHVLCEKPLAVTVAEADRVVDAAAAAGRRVALNHEFRTMPITDAVRRALGSGDAGPLRVAQVWQNMDLPPWKERGWRATLFEGVLFEAGIHLVDYAQALFGATPVAVQATMSTCGARPELSDSVAVVVLTFGDGRLAHVVQNRLSPGDTQFFEVRADAERASFRASFGGRARVSAGLHHSTRPHLRLEWGPSGLAWREDGPRRTVIARNPREAGMVATRELLRRTVAALRDGTPAPIEAAEARDGLAVLAAIYESARTGRRVPVAEAHRAPLRDDPIGRLSPR